MDKSTESPSLLKPEGVRDDAILPGEYSCILRLAIPDVVMYSPENGTETCLAVSNLYFLFRGKPDSKGSESRFPTASMLEGPGLAKSVGYADPLAPGCMRTIRRYSRFGTGLYLPLTERSTLLKQLKLTHLDTFFGTKLLFQL